MILQIKFGKNIQYVNYVQKGVTIWIQVTKVKNTD